MATLIHSLPSENKGKVLDLLETKQSAHPEQTQRTMLSTAVLAPSLEL